MITVPAPLLAGFLVAVGIVTAAPLSGWLARARWTSRGPTVTLLLWQSICLCSGLSLTASALVIAVEPLGDSLSDGLTRWLQNLLSGKGFAGLSLSRIAVLLIAIGFAGYLLAVLIVTAVLGAGGLRRHRLLLDLITDVDASDAAVRLLDEPAPLAWTVPGRGGRRLVLTAGLVDLLDDDQLQAVLAHERAHLSVRHDVLLLPFRAWAAALPVPGMRAAQVAVGTLVEMQADDLACRSVARQTVASAIAAVVLSGRPGSSATAVPTGALHGWGVPGPSAAAARVRRLHAPAPLSLLQSAAVVATAVVLVLLPVAAVFVPWN